MSKGTAVDRVLALAAIAAVAVAVAVWSRKISAASAAGGLQTWRPGSLDTLAVIIVSSGCPACNGPEFVGAVRKALNLEAGSGREAFHYAGVSVDWSIPDGLTALRELGPFTEVSTGNGWGNARLFPLIWADSFAVAGTPQLVLVERSVTMGVDERYRLTAESAVGRVYGATAMQAWFAQRYPAILPGKQSPTSETGGQ